MKRYVKSSIDFEVLSDIIDDVYVNMVDYIYEDREYVTYDDVISETYSQIQGFTDDMPNFTADDEDKVFDAVIDKLDDEGYINSDRGEVL